MNDPRWGIFKDRPSNRLALSIRNIFTERSWFEGLVLLVILFVGIQTVREICFLMAVLGAHVHIA